CCFLYFLSMTEKKPAGSFVNIPEAARILGIANLTAYRHKRFGHGHVDSLPQKDTLSPAVHVGYFPETNAFQLHIVLDNVSETTITGDTLIVKQGNAALAISSRRVFFSPDTTVVKQREQEEKKEKAEE